MDSSTPEGATAIDVLVTPHPQTLPGPGVAEDKAAQPSDKGYVSIFDGKSLKGWHVSAWTLSSDWIDVGTPRDLAKAQGEV